MGMRLLTLTSIMILGGVPGMFAQVAAGPFPCVSASLAAYTAGSGADCTVGTNLEFRGFTFDFSGSGANSDLASLITVIPDPDGLGGGFTFSGWGNGVVGANQIATYTIGYSYAIFGDPPTMDAASLGMDPVFGAVTINQAICPPGFDCFNEGVSSTNPPFDGCGGLPNLSGTCWVATTSLPNISGANSTNIITLTGSGNGGAGFDDFDAIYHVVPDPNETPEPMTAMLGLSGLVAIGLVRRYRMG
jgi:hypothetical protein